jgi:hypothetical protein
MEEENMHLQAHIEENTKATEDANAKALELLDKLDAVRIIPSSKGYFLKLPFDQVYELWQKLPTDKIEEWTVQSAESLKPTLLS